MRIYTVSDAFENPLKICKKWPLIVFVSGKRVIYGISYWKSSVHHLLCETWFNDYIENLKKVWILKSIFTKFNMYCITVLLNLCSGIKHSDIFIQYIFTVYFTQCPFLAHFWSCKIPLRWSAKNQHMWTLMCLVYLFCIRTINFKLFMHWLFYCQITILGRFSNDDNDAENDSL